MGTLHRPNASQVATGSLQSPPRGLCSENGYRQAFANRANGGPKLGGRAGRLGASDIMKRVVATILSHARLRRYLAFRERLRRSTQAMVTRFMGLIVASMGMQFVLTGLKAFLHT